jgi:hypothetical protein
MSAVLKEVSGMSDGEVTILTYYCLYANLEGVKVIMIWVDNFIFFAYINDFDFLNLVLCLAYNLVSV